MTKNVILACLDNLSFIELPPDHILADSNDVELREFPGIPDGVYRRVDRVFIQWLHDRLQRAKRPKSAVPKEKIDEATDFLLRLHNATGISTCDPVDKPAHVPFSYRRPEPMALPDFNEVFSSAGRRQSERS